jgi:hypothetical protein
MGDVEVIERLVKQIDVIMGYGLGPSDEVYSIARFILNREKGLHKILAAALFYPDKIDRGIIPDVDPAAIPSIMKRGIYRFRVPTGLLAAVAPEAILSGDGGENIYVEVRSY